jgi:chemotaxis protein MotB
VAAPTRIIYVKKKAKAHAHHGGAWKVAYADFVTAMMALFIVLWLLSQTNEEQREKLAEYFRTGVLSGAPSVLSGGNGIQNKGFLDVAGASDVSNENTELDRMALTVRSQLERAVKETPELQALAGQVKVSVTDDGLLIQILDGSEDLLFDLSSAELKPRLITLLKDLAPVLGRMPNKIQLHGHTDGRPFPAGSTRTNWQLSFDRADRARNVLESAGVRPGQISGVFAHGDQALYDAKNPFAPENRRLAILAVRRGKEQPASRGVATSPSARRL